MSRTEVLTDEMWAQIEPLLPPLKGRMGRPRAPYRPLVEGAIYRLRTGVAWRDLPAEFGPWQTVWKRHYEFCNDGTWDKVLTALQAAGRRPWGDRLASLGRLHDRPGASAGRGRCEVAADADVVHRGPVELQGSAP